MSEIGLRFTLSPRSAMAKTFPWHSIRQSDRNVYHDDDLCPIAGEIEPKYRKSGRRCRPECRACAKLRAAADHTERLARPKPGP